MGKNNWTSRIKGAFLQPKQAGKGPAIKLKARKQAPKEKITSGWNGRNRTVLQQKQPEKKQRRKEKKQRRKEKKQKEKEQNTKTQPVAEAEAGVGTEAGTGIEKQQGADIDYNNTNLLGDDFLTQENRLQNNIDFLGGDTVNVLPATQPVAVAGAEANNLSSLTFKASVGKDGIEHTVHKYRNNKAIDEWKGVLNNNNLTAEEKRKIFDNLQENLSKGPGIGDYAMAYKVPQRSAGAGITFGLVNSLSNSRGRQTNAQLYGQAPLV